MKQLLFILILTLGFDAQDTRKENSIIPDEGLVIVEYNAPFNLKNSYEGFSSLSNVNKSKINIESNPAERKEMKIRNVPTLILFLDNKEVNRWTAGLDMKIHTPVSEIQKSINQF